MSEDNPVLLEEMMIPGHRLLVVNELGPVHKGDHLVMVANVIVAVDTSRRPSDVILPGTRSATSFHTRTAATSPPTRRVYRKKVVPPIITTEQVYTIVRDNQPVKSIMISDKLGLQRDDLKSRATVGRLLKLLINEGKVQRYQDETVRLFRYETINNNTASSSG